MLDIETSILIIIDIQERLTGACSYGEEAARNMTKLAKTANILSVPIVITEQYPKGLGSTVKQLSDVFSCNIFKTEKSSFSAMSEPAFAQKLYELKSAGRTQILIGGIETHICVLQTAFDLMKEGFEVYAVKDACASRNKHEYKTGLQLMKQYGAKITCVEIALFEWLKTSKHPNFKEVQTLIK